MSIAIITPKDTIVIEDDIEEVPTPPASPATTIEDEDDGEYDYYPTTPAYYTPASPTTTTIEDDGEQEAQTREDDFELSPPAPASPKRKEAEAQAPPAKRQKGEEAFATVPYGPKEYGLRRKITREEWRKINKAFDELVDRMDMLEDLSSNNITYLEYEAAKKMLEGIQFL